MTELFSVAEYSGSTLAWADAWPGLIAGAPEREGLGAVIPLALAEYAAWLNSHGMEGPSTGWHMSEVVTEAETAAPGGEFCFAADRAPLAGEELSRAMAHARLAMEELARAADLPDLLLD